MASQYVIIECSRRSCECRNLVHKPTVICIYILDQYNKELYQVFPDTPSRVRSELFTNSIQQNPSLLSGSQSSFRHLEAFLCIYCYTPTSRYCQIIFGCHQITFSLLNHIIQVSFMIRLFTLLCLVSLFSCCFTHLILSTSS